MQGHFSINLPSIPTSKMKFKIQDVRLKGFLAKEARFKDDKTYLTKRFLHSFPNLLQKTDKKSEETQENKSQLSTISSIIPKEEQVTFRWMIGDDKKNLLIKYEEKYKSYSSRIQSQFINHKGFSFGKEGLKDSLDGQMNKYKSVALEAENKGSIQNYYFNQTLQSESDDQELEKEIRREERLNCHKKVQASPAFKSQDRWKFGDRLLSSQIEPGPGSYSIQTPKKINRKMHKSANPEVVGIDLKKIKGILRDFSIQKINEEQKVIDKKPSKQNYHTSSFILGNHDRFGSEVYPISGKINVPGPGSYQFHNSLEQNANRILILEQQRKLLKEWHDN